MEKTTDFGSEKDLFPSIEILTPKDGEVLSLQTNLQKYFWNEAIRKPVVDPDQPIHSPVENGDRTRSIPAPVLFSFSISPEGAEIVLTLSENPDLSHPERVIRSEKREIPVYNLKTGKKYYFRAEAKAGNRSVETGIVSFSTADLVPRWINIPGCINVRDIGGFKIPGGRIKQGMIYRGATPEAVTEEGKKIAKTELGIKTEIELRYQFPEDIPSFFGDGVNYVLCGTAGYYIKHEDYIPGYRKFFKLLANEKNYPIYMHCHAGADRTGTNAHLIHSLLGVPRNVRAADYDQTTLSELSACRNRNCEPYKDWLFPDLRSFDGGDPNVSDSVCAERYLRFIGITDEEIERIKSILTEKTDEG